MKIGLLFPGQGIKKFDLIKNLYSECSIVREVFTEANEVLDMDIKEICINGSKEELKNTTNSQPIILTISYAMYKTYLE
ncbi:[acyl-carrier-protein] S-malonyltransferase [Clostridium sp. DSM 8431]|uniref:ACP S-malonyltransferase n=1 Tax=Clostridium sp. DSM 8431 TaxID=1761781 RepID=UPI0008E90D72|nr:ACP S-malonyltransferase [Clostridium sp. DSM 8431]SFU74496.1 [acyl-carrier-protein] S-malonyltransferase [Clostridium sp. DSM 8431]